jgi:hypothetical protein
MKRGMLQVLVLVCGLFAFSGQLFAQSVTAVGRAEIVGSNRDGARSNALTNAFREAVEKGIGVWVQSQTEVKDAALVRDQILTRAQGYVTEHEIVKEKVEDNMMVVTIRASVAVDLIGADIKSLVGRVSTSMGNPSITFVLTTWEKRGSQGSSSRSDAAQSSQRSDSKSKYDLADDSSASESASASLDLKQKSDSQASNSSRERAALSARGQASQQSSGSASGRFAAGGQYAEGNGYAQGRVGYAASGQQSSDQSGNLSASGQSAYDGSSQSKSSGSYAGDMKANASQSSSTRSKGHNDASLAVDSSSKVKLDSSFSKIDEDIWVKYPDTTIIDSFNQEFKEKSFKLNAGDKAREIALSKSVKETFVNPFDRLAVRQAAEKEGVNFVARGEVKMLDTMISESTGNTEVTCEVGVEIIDVSTGDVVAAYRNTATAGSSRPMEAKAQSIKKIAVLAARTLANQTIETWQNASLNGKEYTVEIRNVKSKRSQERPILNVLEALGSISNTTNPESAVLLVKMQFKGLKKKLEDGILDQLGSKPGFSEKEFDGPETVDGKIVFTFK